MESLTSLVWLIYGNILHDIWPTVYCSMVYNISVNILGNILLCIPYNIRNKNIKSPKKSDTHLDYTISNTLPL